MDSPEEALMLGKAGPGWEPLDPSYFIVLFSCASVDLFIMYVYAFV